MFFTHSNRAVSRIFFIKSIVFCFRYLQGGKNIFCPLLKRILLLGHKGQEGRAEYLIITKQRLGLASFPYALLENFFIGGRNIFLEFLQGHMPLMPHSCTRLYIQRLILFQRNYFLGLILKKIKIVLGYNSAENMDLGKLINISHSNCFFLNQSILI